jgi:hypothetical protein
LNLNANLNCGIIVFVTDEDIDEERMFLDNLSFLGIENQKPRIVSY